MTSFWLTSFGSKKSAILDYANKGSCTTLKTSSVKSPCLETPIYTLKLAYYVNYNQSYGLIWIWPHLYANEVSIQIDQGIIQLRNMFYCIWHVLHAFFIHINPNPMFMISRYMVYDFVLTCIFSVEKVSHLVLCKSGLVYNIKTLSSVFSMFWNPYIHLNHLVTWIITRVIWWYRFDLINMQMRSSCKLIEVYIQLHNMFYCLWHVLHQFFIHKKHNYTFMISRYMVWLRSDLHLLGRKSQPSWIMQIRFPVQLWKLVQCILHV